MTTLPGSDNTHRSSDPSADETEVLETERLEPVGESVAATPTADTDDGDEADEVLAEAGSVALPDFAAPTAEEESLDSSHSSTETAAPKDELTHEGAEAFVEHSHKEHANNLVSIVLVLLAPAAFFGTMWWPFSSDTGASLAEENLSLATIVGLSTALALIIIGLIVHFAPRGRHELLPQVERGELAPSAESVALAERHRAARRLRNRVLLALGTITAVATMALIIVAFLSLGKVTELFGYFALASVLAAATFALLYSPFTTRRTARHLGHDADARQG